MRWYCTICGHFHGNENCTAITSTETGTRKCGCQDHKPGT